MTEVGSGKPQRTAVLTALLWHVLPLGVIILIVAAAAVQPHTDGEDWSGVIVAILLTYGLGLLTLAAGMSAVVAAVIVGRRLRRGPVSTRAAIGWGSLGTLIAWSTGVAVFAAGGALISG